MEQLERLAANLNRLMASVPQAPSSPRLWSDRGLAQAMTARGCPTTHVWVLKTRSGELRNPSAAKVAAMADIFGVPVSYFFDAGVASSVNARLDAHASGTETRAEQQ